LAVEVEVLVGQPLALLEEQVVVAGVVEAPVVAQQELEQMEPSIQEAVVVEPVTTHHPILALRLSVVRELLS
jgi:hypothetical protein